MHWWKRPATLGREGCQRAKLLSCWWPELLVEIVSERHSGVFEEVRLACAEMKLSGRAGCIWGTVVIVKKRCEFPGLSLLSSNLCPAA